MINNQVYKSILDNTNRCKKMFGVLIDPDKQNVAELIKTIQICNNCNVDFFFVGGSIVKKGDMNRTTRLIKENTSKPVIIFPGNSDQLSNYADAILFLSLISGRNPDFLIGHQVTAAPLLKKMQLEVIPTGYLLVNCGTATTAINVSNTEPIAYEDTETAAKTVLAGEYLGLKLTYIDGGSGAKKCISTEMIKQTKLNLTTPLIIGGGIKSISSAKEIYNAGADLIIIGNGAEQNRNLINEIAELKTELNKIS